MCAADAEGRGLASGVDLAAGQLATPLVDHRTPPPADQAIDGNGMALRVLALVETVVLHAAFGPGISHGEPGLVAAYREAEAHHELSGSWRDDSVEPCRESLCLQ
jgi:hypothetical protein